MTVVIAGSRTVSDGWVAHRYDAGVAAHNLALLDAVVRGSGFHTHAVNLHHRAGPGYRIDRRTPLGNPFTHLAGATLARFRVATRAEAIARYAEWFPDQTHLHPLLDEMRGRALLCWCKPAPCHGDYLAALAGTITGVVEGGARGADMLGRKWAERNGLPRITVAADWDRYGLSAGMRRNRQMAERPDVEGGIVLWDGMSRGAANMVEELARVGKPCHVARVRLLGGGGGRVDLFSPGA